MCGHLIATHCDDDKVSTVVWRAVKALAVESLRPWLEGGRARRAAHPKAGCGLPAVEAWLSSSLWVDELGGFGWYVSVGRWLWVRWAGVVASVVLVWPVWCWVWEGVCVVVGVGSDEAGVRDLLGRMVDAWDAHDADAFAELYTEGATVVTTGSYTKSRGKIRAFMAGGFAGPLKGTRSVEEPVEIRFVGADVAIVNSRGGFILPSESVVRDDQERLATWVLARSDGRWLVESYHNCAARKG